MDSSAQLLIAQMLLDEFSILVKASDPYGNDLSSIIKKAKLLEAKMVWFYIKWGKIPEMLELIQKMDSIIKKLEKKQNNHVTDM